MKEEKGGEVRIREFVRDLKALIIRHDVNFQEINQALVILDSQIEEAKRKAMMKKG